jgi:outer membrane protein assembly factor BamE
MQKLLIFLPVVPLLLSGCSGADEKSEYRTSALAELPFVYKMTVQQGNILTEEMVDRLEPGMSRNQVRYLLGTPALTDIFHTDRWYYTYTIRRGHEDMQTKPLVVYFEGDSMVRVEGFMRPDRERAAGREPQDLLVTVPDWDGGPGIVDRALRTVGLEPAE